MTGWRVVLLFLLTSLLVVACRPSWPLCHDDEDCDGQVCLNGQCAQCRDDGHCADLLDERYVCESGACVEVAGYCDAAFPCPRGQRCRQFRCGPWCLHRDECAGDETCERNLCAAPCDCVADLDCPPYHVCSDCACVLAELPQVVRFAPGASRIEVPEMSELLVDRVGQAPLVDPAVRLSVWCGSPEDALATARHAALVDALVLLEFPAGRIVRPLARAPGAAALPEDSCELRWLRPVR